MKTKLVNVQSFNPKENWGEQFKEYTRNLEKDIDTENASS